MQASHPSKLAHSSGSATAILTQYQTQCLYNPKTQRRRVHIVPYIKHNETFQKDGVPGMLSKDGFDLAWTQYHGNLVDRLNKLTAGIPSFASIYSTVSTKISIATLR